MSILSLRLKGFKSFGRSCEFEFSRKFTAIVGPNGSGKSNILDALKWILGEGTSSGLRITKQSDLLFQGSKSVIPADSAEVILRLSSENDKGTLRRVYSRDSGGAIFFDGGRIQLQNLDSVKSQFSLSGEGFALIGQGEISETIHQRPKERRKQLDSLFGIELYREKRNETLSKLDESQTESQRLQTLIDELNARRAEISDDVNIAVQARGIIDNLDVLRHDYYLYQRYSNETEQSNFGIKRHIEESKLEEISEWLNIWTHGLHHYENIIIPDETVNSYASQLESITSRKDSIHRRAFQLSTQLHEIITKRKTLTEELITLKSRKESLEHTREEKRIEKENLSHELEAKQKELSEREHELNESQLALREQIQRRKHVVDEISGLKLKCSRLESEIKASESSHESGLNELHELEESMTSKQTAIEGLERQKNLLEEKFSGLTSSCSQQSSSIQEIRRQITHLESECSSLENSKTFTVSYPDSVMAVLNASRENLIRSNPQVVADVFSCTSSKAASAIDAFLGSRQYWLLARTHEEAYEGIEYLKSNRLGRVTYLVSEVCRPRKHDSELKLSGRITGWAMNLISVQSEWKDSISHLMGDLLIVEDYAAAVDLVRKGAKFPIATAEGEVFSSSGTVSGGTLKRSSGAVMLLQKHEEINIRLEELRKSITDSRIDLESCTEREMRLRRELEDVSGKLERIKYDLNYEHRNLNIITENIRRTRIEYEHSESRIESLRTELADSKRNLESLEHELETMQDIHTENYELSLVPLRNEVNLLNERMNLAVTLYAHIEGEYSSVVSGIMKAESELESGIATENESRNVLRELSREKKAAYIEEQRIRAELSRNNEAFMNSRRKLERIRIKLLRVNERIAHQRSIISGIENRISHLESERMKLIELWDFKYPYSNDEAKRIEGGRELTSSLRKLERELNALGTYNLGALSEDESLAERIDFLTAQLEDVNTGSNELRMLIADTDSQTELDFTDKLSRVDERFNALFQRLFGGGEARLTLQEGGSIWDRGVEIFARPPGKKLQNISQLSGGEQSLTSIALIFATLEAAHTPLAVLDEVDAALDEYNLIRFAELAKEYSDSIQIIAMTHRRATMERADLIYGVTMIEPGLTSMIGIDPKNYA